MLLLYAPAREGGSGRAAGQSAGLPLAPTRVSGEVGDQGTAVPAVTEGAIELPGPGSAPRPVGTVEVGPDEGDADVRAVETGTVVAADVVTLRVEAGPRGTTVDDLPLRRAAWLGCTAPPETAIVTTAPATTTTPALTPATSAVRLPRRGLSQ